MQSDFLFYFLSFSSYLLFTKLSLRVLIWKSFFFGEMFGIVRSNLVALFICTLTNFYFARRMMNFKKWISSQYISNNLLSARHFRFSDDNTTNEEHGSQGILYDWLATGCFLPSPSWLTYSILFLIWFSFCTCYKAWF